MVADRDTHGETVEKDIETQEDYNKNLRDQLSDMDRRVEVYVQEQVYQHTLFANPDFSSSEKLVLLASRSVVRELRADDTSLTDFHLKLTQYSCSTKRLSMLPLLLLMQSYPTYISNSTVYLSQYI